MIYSAKHLTGQNDELLGKWIKVTSEEYEAVRESLSDANYARGAVSKPSLRLYYQDGYAAICTQGVQVEKHPNDS